MNTQSKTLFFVILLFNSIMCFSQDTTFIDKKINYYKKSGDSYRFEKINLKKGTPLVAYAREKIQFSKDSFKIEHCYYYDNLRYTNKQPTIYTIKSDSILHFDNESWLFKKHNDTSFTVFQLEADFKRIGKVNSLIPFNKIGSFITYNSLKDTVFIEKYSNNKVVFYETPQSIIQDSIYSTTEIKPSFPTKYGRLDDYINKSMFHPFYARESSIQGKIYIQFIVCSNGQVKNLKVLRGVDPVLDMEALRVVSKFPNFEPGEMNWKKVNSVLIIPINYRLD